MGRFIAAIALTLSACLLPKTAWAEPQPLPESACNEETKDARATAPEPADSAIPHETRTGDCHHAVPSGG